MPSGKDSFVSFIIMQFKFAKKCKEERHFFTALKNCITSFPIKPGIRKETKTQLK